MKVDLFLQCTQLIGTEVGMTLSIEHIMLVVKPGIHDTSFASKSPFKFCSSIPSLQLPVRILKKWPPMVVQSDGRNFIGETAKMMNGANDKSIISHVYLQ
jgi:hypothetical protein